MGHRRRRSEGSIVIVPKREPPPGIDYGPSIYLGSALMAEASAAPRSSADVDLEEFSRWPSTTFRLAEMPCCGRRTPKRSAR